MDNNQIVANSYIAQGFIIESSNESMMILSKKKKFNKWLFVALCFTGVLWAVYLLYYFAMQKDERVQIVNGLVTKL